MTLGDPPVYLLWALCGAYEAYSPVWGAASLLSLPCASEASRGKSGTGEALSSEPHGHAHGTACADTVGGWAGLR